MSSSLVPSTHFDRTGTEDSPFKDYLTIDKLVNMGKTGAVESLVEFMRRGIRPELWRRSGYRMRRQCLQDVWMWAIEELEGCRAEERLGGGAARGG